MGESWESLKPLGRKLLIRVLALPFVLIDAHESSLLPPTYMVALATLRRDKTTLGDRLFLKSR